jgi:hypothetical protein
MSDITPFHLAPGDGASQWREEPYRFARTIANLGAFGTSKERPRA